VVTHSLPEVEWAGSAIPRTDYMAGFENRQVHAHVAVPAQEGHGGQAQRENKDWMETGRRSLTLGQRYLQPKDGWRRYYNAENIAKTIYFKIFRPGRPVHHAIQEAH